MNRLIEKDQTADFQLESVLEDLASRQIDAETAKAMIARIVANKGNYGSNDNNNRNYDSNVGHDDHAID